MKRGRFSKLRQNAYTCSIGLLIVTTCSTRTPAAGRRRKPRPRRLD
jgi:hypothetical protein